MQRRTLFVSLSAAAASAVLAGCGEEKKAPAKEKTRVILGVTAGSSEQIAEQVAKVAAKGGLTVVVKTFGDYIAVDSALASGDIDLNAAFST